jgi:hypothetical protein
VLEFDGPADGFQYLELELPTANAGSRSIFPIRLRIPAAAVR